MVTALQARPGAAPCAPGRKAPVDQVVASARARCPGAAGDPTGEVLTAVADALHDGALPALLAARWQLALLTRTGPPPGGVRGARG